MLDYTVKIATEIDDLATNFATYPKLRSLNVQFGDRKKLSINREAGTVLEDCSLITTIETLRNHLIHDGLLDDMPKAYEGIQAGQTVERFILMPDMTNGRFDRFKNRNLFFGKEDKINRRLPAVIAEFEQRMEATASLILHRAAHADRSTS